MGGSHIITDESVNRTKKDEVPGALGERLQALLRELVSRKEVKHAIMAVERGDGSLRWIGVAGDAYPDGTPMREDTPIWMASVTKLYIAAVVLKLHERGLLDLAERIATYLPPSLTRGIHRLEGTDYSEAITVRHLLTHSSGLPDFLEERPAGGKSLFDRIPEQDMAWTIEDAMALVRESLKPYFPPQPFDAKRQKLRYSDTNFQLLIAIIEAVTGKSIHEAFDELLYKPLGLERTYHPDAAPEDAPKPATVWLADRPLDIPLAMRSFGDLISTADEMLRFMKALSRGEVFDDPHTIGLMQESWNTFRFSLNLAPLSPGWPIEYGLGMMRFRIPRLFTPLRPLPPLVGHSGASGSWLFHCPELDVYLAGTVDQVTAAAVPYRFVPKVLRVLASSAR